MRAALASIGMAGPDLTIQPDPRVKPEDDGRGIRR